MTKAVWLALGCPAGMTAAGPVAALSGDVVQAVPEAGPEVTAGAPSDSFEIALDDLGVVGETVFEGDGATAEIAVPVLAGMTLAALVADVEPSSGSEGGWLRFDSGGSTEEVALQRGESRTVEIPLAGAAVGDDGQVIVRGDRKPRRG